MHTLTEIGIRYNTDKATLHKFTDFYENQLSHLKNDSIKLLEIGVLNGGSLKMWEEFFPQGTIYGADINDKTHLQTARIFTQKCNQENPESLKSLFAPLVFDVVIDDGGHTMLQQQLTLLYLLPKIRSGGKFIMEDLHTSYRKFRGHNKNNKKTTMSLLTQYSDFFSDNLPEESVLDGYEILPEEVASIRSRIHDVTIWSGPGCRSVTSIITVK